MKTENKDMPKDYFLIRMSPGVGLFPAGGCLFFILVFLVDKECRNQVFHLQRLFWFFLIMVIGCIWFLKLSFSNKVLWIISTKGVWEKSQGLIPWTDIDACHSERTRDGEIFYFYTTGSWKDIRINLSGTNVINADSMRELVNRFKGSHLIDDLGETKQEWYEN